MTYESQVVRQFGDMERKMTEPCDDADRWRLGLGEARWGIVDLVGSLDNHLIYAKEKEDYIT